MTFNELLDLLAVKIGEEPSSRRRRTKSVVLSACSPFVEVDYEADFVNPTLRLAHKTIGDFLSQDPTTLDFVTEDCYKFFVNYKNGNADLGRRCLTYLSYKRYADFGSLDTADCSPDHGFLKYAAIFWHQHFKRAGGDHELFDVVRGFLKSPNMWTCIRVQSKYAPHLFAKLSYNSKLDSYRMHKPSSAFTQGSSSETYYADALPPWIADYDNHGDHLIWGYHMFVKEWAEALVGHPDKIERYFTQVLGSRSFWNEKPVAKASVRVTTLEGNMYVPKNLEKVEELCHPTWHTKATGELNLQTGVDESIPQYIKNVLEKLSGKWNFSRSTTVECAGVTVVVYRYHQYLATSREEEDETKDDREEDNDDEDGNIKPSLAHESAASWFLSVSRGGEATHWFDHVAKSGVLQKSAPIFIPQRPWLLWSHDESSLFVLNLDTWASSDIPLPPQEKSELVLVSLGMSQRYKAPLSRQWLIHYRASLVVSHELSSSCFHLRLTIYKSIHTEAHDLSVLYF